MTKTEKILEKTTIIRLQIHAQIYNNYLYRRIGVEPDLILKVLLYLMHNRKHKSLNLQLGASIVAGDPVYVGSYSIA